MCCEVTTAFIGKVSGMVDKVSTGVVIMHVLHTVRTGFRINFKCRTCVYVFASNVGGGRWWPLGGGSVQMAPKSHITQFPRESPQINT